MIAVSCIKYKLTVQLMSIESFLPQIASVVHVVCIYEVAGA